MWRFICAFGITALLDACGGGGGGSPHLHPQVIV